MAAAYLLAELLDAGLTLTADADGRLLVAPAARITDRLRALIRQHKGELLEAVRNAERETAELFAAVHACCDVRGDDALNRAALLDECSRLGPRDRADLSEHFDAEASRWRRATGGAT